MRTGSAGPAQGGWLWGRPAGLDGTSLQVGHLRTYDARAGEAPLRGSFDSMTTTSIDADDLHGKRVLVVGLGRFGGGVGVTRWLATRGARVTVLDEADRRSLAASIDAIAGLDVNLHLGDNDPRRVEGADLVVLNPAIDKRRSALFEAVVRRGVPWTTEINLFCERCRARVIGVTGSYGKSTTSAMLFDALRACEGGESTHSRTYLGGNIGRSLLEELPDIRADDLVVLELSNAQLEDLPRIGWTPEVAVITNIEPHHLERYDGFEGYVDAKLNIVRDPHRRSTVVVGPLTEQVRTRLSAVLGGCCDRLIHIAAPPHLRLRVPGRHNLANAAAAWTVCGHLGLPPTPVRGAIEAFSGLPHRLQHVRCLDQVDYYNDSKSTAPATTIAAVSAFEGPVVVIVGGQPKSCPDLPELVRTLVARCRAVVCTGASGPGIATQLRAGPAGSRNISERAVVEEAADLPAALLAARRLARHGDAVLFSPAAPSFDAYANFAERGAHFVRLVNEL